MKNLILLAIGATLLSTSAFASKARLEALGEDQFGSQYISDNRNMFLNAAQIHNHADFLIFEFGDTGGVFDREAEPKATGGYFARNGDAIYGIYLGQDSNTASSLRLGPFNAILGLVQASSALSTQIRNDIDTIDAEVGNNNTIDFFYGRDGAMKWGLRLSHSQSSNEQGVANQFDEASQSATLLGLGVVSGDWEYYLNAGLNNEAEVKNFDTTMFDADGIGAGGAGLLTGKDYSVKGGLGVQGGAIKQLGDGAVGFVEVRSITIEQDGLGDVNTGSAVLNLDQDQTFNSVNLGYAKAHKMNDALTAFYRLEYYQNSYDNFNYIKDWETKTSYVRATLGFEHRTLSWLHFRGSVSNNIISEEDVDGHPSDEDGKRTIDNVQVRLGASIVFGDFQIDGLIANDTDGDGTLDETNTNTDFAADDDNGILRTDSLLSRVSFAYNF